MNADDTQLLTELIQDNPVHAAKLADTKPEYSWSYIFGRFLGQIHSAWVCITDVPPGVANAELHSLRAAAEFRATRSIMLELAEQASPELKEKVKRIFDRRRRA